MITALRVRGAAYLLVTALVGRLPQAMSALAVVRLVRDQGGDFSVAAALTSVYVVAGTVGQPLLGRWLDRSGRPRLVLGVSGIVATLGLVGLAFAAADALPLGVACAVVAGVATPPLESCLRSLWVRMMEPGAQLHAAFSLDAAAQELLFIAGPLVTAAGILLFGARGNMLLMAALGLVGTLLFLLHPRARRREPEISDGRGGSPMRLAPFRRLVLFQFAAGFPIGVLTITTTTAGEVYGAESLGAWGLAINAAGALLGAVLIGRRPLRTPAHRAVRILGFVLAMLYLPTVLVAAPVWVWLVTAFVAGVALPPLLTQVFQQTSAAVPASQLNEANAWVVSAFSVGIAGGTLVAGLVAGIGSSVIGVVIGVAIGSIVTIVGALCARPRALAP